MIDCISATLVALRRKVRAYRTSEPVADEWTFVLVGHEFRERDGTQGCFAIGENPGPTNPQGFSQYSSCHEGHHLGRRVPLTKVPESLLAHVAWRLRE